MRGLLLLGLWVAVTACGARSQLGDDDPVGNGGKSAGPGSGGGAGGTGAAGAGGGGPVTCDGLQVGTGPIYLDAPHWPFFHTARPDLVGLEDDSLVWVTSLVPVESPGPVPHEIGQAVIEPWDTFTSDPVQRVAIAGGRSVLSTETGRVGLYALAFDPDYPNNATFSTRVLRTLDPNIAFPSGGIMVGPNGARPELLVELEEGLLFGYEIGPGPSLLGLARVHDTLENEVTIESGCADPRVRAGAVATGGGAIIAMASGREPYACFDDDGVIGPPTRLQTGFVDGTNLTLTVSEDEIMPEPIHYLDVVGGPDRAWVIWQTDGSTSEQPPPVQARRLDPTGAFAGPLIEITSGGFFPPFGATAFGDGLAFAHIDAIDPGPPTLVVVVYDDEGERIAEASHPLPLVGFGSRLAIRTSPDRDAVLIAWAEQGGAGQPNPTAFLRFDCLAR